MSNPPLEWAGSLTLDGVSYVRSGSFSAGHGHEACWSNPVQMAGQVECKQMGKSVQLPICRGNTIHNPDNPKRELSHMLGDQHRFHFINNALGRM
ncbi:hypothetical protein [Pseudomonas sp. GL-B-16]|uniref:hypothetical protein n=1 Tax=Pseudomonas sp. GL-B-16 TaxID=2832373 RepID=UPI001CBC6982|nr:hypothetical protein [Pseudomonas sp. GL-B-16]